MARPYRYRGLDTVRGRLPQWPYGQYPYKFPYNLDILDSYSKKYQDRELKHWNHPEDEPNVILDDEYVAAMERILSGPPYMGIPPEPTPIYGINVLLGCQADAENLDSLKRMKITHVLNCSGIPASMILRRKAKYQDTKIRYSEIPADDYDQFNIAEFFNTTYQFIEEGRLTGKTLIYSEGVSRSGAVAIAYLLHMGKRLLAATRQLKEDRRVLLTNKSFMKQLVTHARMHKMVEDDVGSVRAPRYFRKIDTPSIVGAYLGMV